jgi:pimeloyl-ACP methyl ester carboxylesterase
MYFCSQYGGGVNGGTKVWNARLAWGRMTHASTPGKRLGPCCALFAALGLGASLLPGLLRTVSTLVVLARLTGQHALDPLAERMLLPVVEHDTALRVADGLFRARSYAPLAAHSGMPGVLLLHGVHPRGIDEPRLVGFARTLASAGLIVLTPELPELLSYRLDPRTIDHIRQLAAAHAQSTGTPAVGVIGISFAGGLALMAAAAQADSRPIAFVATVGAHADLLRLSRYYAGEPVRGPAGEPVDVAPHPYGARVMIREHLERFFSRADLAPAQRALDAYLHDRGAEARKLALQLSSQGRPVMGVLLDSSQHSELAQLLLSAASAARPQLQAASPHGHLAGLRVPVFLLHGAGDPVIPSIETRYLAREVPRAWLRQVVVTPLLRHAEFPEPPKLGEAWQLVRFLTGIFAAAGSSVRSVPARGP